MTDDREAFLRLSNRRFEFRWNHLDKWIITSPDIAGLHIVADTVADGLRQLASTIENIKIHPQGRPS